MNGRIRSICRVDRLPTNGFAYRQRMRFACLECIGLTSSSRATTTLVRVHTGAQRFTSAAPVRAAFGPRAASGWFPNARHNNRNAANLVATRTWPGIISTSAGHPFCKIRYSTPHFSLGGAKLCEPGDNTDRIRVTSRGGGATCSQGVRGAGMVKDGGLSVGWEAW